MMFKKYAKTLLDKEVSPAFEESLPPTPSLFTAEIPTLQEIPEEPSVEEPETTIGERVIFKGTLSFQTLLRIDGTFEGELISEGKLIIGPTGSVKANINMQEAFISGKVDGDITVKERLVLRGRAEIRGNIHAPILSVDEGVSIIGQLNVTSPTT
jgi:cytoskeletal protein CcmA (bactofilin family)